MAATSPNYKPPSNDNIIVRLFRLLFDIRVIGVLAQIAAVVLVVLFFRWIGQNTAANIGKLGDAQFICRDQTSSFRCAFDFLQSDSQFEISEGPLDYSPASSYWLALGQGFMNTLKVVSLGIVLTTILGTLVGIARLSTNWLVNNIARWYVDLFRNTPLVVQLVFIFFVFFSNIFPSVNDVEGVLGLPIYFSKRGVNFPSLALMSSAAIWLAFVVLGLIQAQLLWVFLGKREEMTGKSSNRLIWGIVGFLVTAVLGYGIAGTRPSTHGIMSPTGLRVQTFDDLDQLTRQRFDVNFADQVGTQSANYDEVIDLIEARQVRIGGERVTLEAFMAGEYTQEQIEDRVGFAYLTPDQVEANALKLCAVRDTNASVNFTTQLNKAGIPYTLNEESRAGKATESYMAGECDVFVGNLSVLAAERDLLENGAAHNIATIDEPPVVLSIPRLQGFNFIGGAKLTNFFAAMLLGLVLNTGANVAEIVRAGIQSVSKGQTEAARALGLSESQRLQLVILPQALTVIIPPLISQYLNLAKNSTLGVAIGYMEFWTVSNTIINQSGRAIQPFVIVMGTFLVLSITISAFLNWYNSRVVLKER